MSVQPVKHCADCGAIIAGPDTPTNTYNRIKYCRDCAKERRRWNNACYQKQFRLDRRERNRLMREQCKLLQRENAALRQRLATLETMNQELRGFV